MSEIDKPGGIQSGGQPANHIKLLTTLSRSRLAVSTGGTVYLLVQLAAPECSSEGRLPLNLAAVFYRSGSMEGGPSSTTPKGL